jgi:hypothetical protein
MRCITLLPLTCIVVVVSSSAAFLLVPNACPIITTTTTGNCQPSFVDPNPGVVRLHNTDLGMVKKGKKKPLSMEETKIGIDYGKVLVLFVDPRNPYSWFLYILGFITIYGTISGN